MKNASETSRPEISRKRSLVLAAVIVLLLFLCVLVLRENSFNRSMRRPLSQSTDAAEANSESGIPLPAVMNKAQEPSANSSDAHSTPAANATEHESGALDSPPTGAILGNVQSAPFAVVDLQRILATRQADASSPESRSNLLANIKRITNARARAHNVEFVFDVSAQSLVGTPMFFAPTNAVPDITDEVLKELSQ
jgi:hypothetical protein